jgi:hypothetical protein
MGCSTGDSVPGLGLGADRGLQARADAAGLITWDVSVDSTVPRVHLYVAGARKRRWATASPWVWPTGLPRAVPYGAAGVKGRTLRCWTSSP